MKLYGYWRSSASYRVRILLGLKGVAYDYVPVHLIRDGGEQNRTDFVEKSPLAQVPALELEGPEGVRHLTQSVAIAEYLEEVHPEPSLLPSDPWQRARARELAEMVNAGIQPLQNTRVLLRLQAEGVDPKVWSQEVIARGFAGIEARLEATLGRHAVGDTLGWADAFLVPQLYGARRFEVDLAPYPRLLRVEAACADHPAFVAAHPDRQIDALPPEERAP